MFKKVTKNNTVNTNENNKTNKNHKKIIYNNVLEKTVENYSFREWSLKDSSKDDDKTFSKNYNSYGTFSDNKNTEKKSSNSEKIIQNKK